MTPHETFASGVAIIAGPIDFLSKPAAPALPRQLRALLHGD